MKKGFFWVLMMMLSVVTLGIGSTSGQAEDLPDLIITDILVQNDAGAGFKIFITDITRNIGTAATKSPSITNYYLKPQDSVTYPGKMMLLGSRYVVELAKKTASIGGNYVALPAKNVLLNKGWPVQGDYYIVAVADALKYIPEINEGNNKRRVEITILDPTAP